MWYSMWQPEMVDTTANAIVTLIGGDSGATTTAAPVTVSSSSKSSKQSEKAPAVAVSSPSTKTTSSMSKDDKLVSAFTMLTTEFNCMDYTQMVSKLSELGLEDGSDLGSLETADVTELSNLLKKGKRSKFIAYFE